jgi:hypothetical protein
VNWEGDVSFQVDGFTFTLEDPMEWPHNAPELHVDVEPMNRWGIESLTCMSHGGSFILHVIHPDDYDDWKLWKEENAREGPMPGDDWGRR